MPTSYSLSDFDYHLPHDLIATHPAHPRDSARLLVFDRQSGKITDGVFRDIDQYLVPSTTLAANNSKVEKCRLTIGKMEIFILRSIDDRHAEALVRPGKKFRKGSTVKLDDKWQITINDVRPDGVRVIASSLTWDDPHLDHYRHIPLPPYIPQNDELADEYQTVYSKPLGSKAAPTAGLHFTDTLLHELKQKHQWAEVTLHVGMGTFAPVKTDDLDKHEMHSEWFAIDQQTSDVLNSAKYITAVGTTTLRALESSQLRENTRHFKPMSAETDIFIRPGYGFRAVDSLITNFHLPKSTLLMLVAAFTGYDEMRAIYDHAIKERYRFYSFGDAMLIV